MYTNLLKKLDLTSSSSVIEVKYQRNHFGTILVCLTKNDEIAYRFVLQRVVRYKGTPSYASHVVDKNQQMTKM